MHKLSFKGIFAGAAANILTALILGFGVGLLSIVLVRLHGVPEARTLHAERAEIRSLTPLIAAIALVCPVLGGYVAGKVAGHDKTINGGFSSLFGVCLSIYRALSGTSFYSIPLLIVLTLLSIPLAALGGLLQSKRGGPTGRSIEKSAHS